MAWIPYIETGLIESSEDESTSIEYITSLLSELVCQLQLLNARVEEAFNTGINEDDLI